MKLKHAIYCSLINMSEEDERVFKVKFNIERKAYWRKYNDITFDDNGTINTDKFLGKTITKNYILVFAEFMGGWKNMWITKDDYLSYQIENEEIPNINDIEKLKYESKKFSVCLDLNKNIFLQMRNAIIKIKNDREARKLVGIIDII